MQLSRPLAKSRAQWCQEIPVLQAVSAAIPSYFQAPPMPCTAEFLESCPIATTVIDDAAARLERFRPFLAAAFPETSDDAGLIESATIELPKAQAALYKQLGFSVPGKLLLKADHTLPIAGSVKARGGIHEVLAVAERLAKENGILKPDQDTSTLHSPEARSFFAKYQIAVGSTGNLGISIGIIGAALGFQVTVHMAAAAKEWKKKLLHSHGVTVVEYQGDYGEAVVSGRTEAAQNPHCHFVDDENSLALFAGYAVAARRLQRQLRDMNIAVDADHPLFVYLPCGVGGAPGGITFGLKEVFGDDVICIFAEPTHSPCMLLGLATGLHDKISVEDFGLDNCTAADGLAVGRASGLVGQAIGPLVSGVFTSEDERLYALLTLLADTENIRMEPSALAGLACLAHPETKTLFKQFSEKNLATSTHLIWGTGGALVPQQEMDKYYQQGKSLLSDATQMKKLFPSATISSK
ncbi:MAG: D-serine ammonia-lyase [Deltaproteobacteria bacterium]|nr:MAG: D-serine ammonia-lyase [Deltaproteobacteria bacterium]